MQELLFGSWGPQLIGFSRHIVAWTLQYPWRVFAAVLVVILLMDLMFRKRASGAGDGLELGGLDFGGGDGDGGGD
ncbi:MAG: hypothetical protein J0H42_01000 [Rhizobiales bacterium]|nr:hypothetical protein [Hyphomicrobiales bacterium]